MWYSDSSMMNLKFSKSIRKKSKGLSGWIKQLIIVMDSKTSMKQPAKKKVEKESLVLPPENVDSSSRKVNTKTGQIPSLG